MKFLTIILVSTLVVYTNKCQAFSKSFMKPRLFRQNSVVVKASFIEPSGSRLPANRPKISESSTELPVGDSVDYNWKYGVCQSKVSFEGAQTIKRFKFVGDLMSMSFVDGKVCVIRLSTGDIIDKYHEHVNEITSLDFDGLHLCSGGYDGALNLYSLSFNNSKSFGTVLHKFPKLHIRPITGLKIMKIKNNGETQVMVASCGLDRKLVCIDYNSGKIIYQVQLSGTPLCMDYHEGYLAIGTNDGKVLFLKGSTGAQLLFFQTQTSKVKAVHLCSSSILFTGSEDGRITRWDLSGNTVSSEMPYDMAENKLLTNMNKRPTRFLDYYFLEAQSSIMANMMKPIGKKDGTNATNKQWQNSMKGISMIYADAEHTSGVVSLQGDKEKIVAAYEDGTVTCWETVTGIVLFDLKGRTKAITTVQYDSTRLIADGTYTAVVLHDFSGKNTTNENISNEELLLVLNAHGEEEENDMTDSEYESDTNDTMGVQVDIDINSNELITYDINDVDDDDDVDDTTTTTTLSTPSTTDSDNIQERSYNEIEGRIQGDNITNNNNTDDNDITEGDNNNNNNNNTDGSGI